MWLLLKVAPQLKLYSTVTYFFKRFTFFYFFHVFYFKKTLSKPQYEYAKIQPEALLEDASAMIFY